MIKNPREEINLQLANQLLQFSELIKESANSFSLSNHCAFMISDEFSFDFYKFEGNRGLAIYSFFLYDEVKSLPTYKICLTFASDYVETELERFKKSAGDYVKLYTAKGSLMAPSLVTLQALVSNIHTYSAVSLFSEGLRQLGFEGEI